MKVAINGFGRIGRLFLRSCLERGEDVEVVAVNDITSAENLAYLLQYDTVYGRFDGEISVKDNSLHINYKNKSISVSVLSIKSPLDLPWQELGVDVVIESTGLFLTEELAQDHIKAGAKKVLLTAPAKSPSIPTVVMGVNEIPQSTIISNASCTTNCVSPFLFALTNSIGLESVAGVTVHAYTATQNLQDGPNKKLRSGRSASSNIVPSTTGASDAVTSVIPSLNGKFTLTSVRVPVIVGSYVYLIAELSRSTTKSEIISILDEYSKNKGKGILYLESDPIVSSDIIGTTYSSIVDTELLQVVSSNQRHRLEAVLWYDNEWGYTQRLVDVLTKLSQN